jgi:hypothetical protein
MAKFLLTPFLVALLLLLVRISDARSHYLRRNIAAEDLFSSKDDETIIGGHYQRRHLNFLGVIIDILTPSISSSIENRVAQDFDPIFINDATTQAISQVNISDICTPPANITFELGALTGLGGMDIASLSLVGGSETIDMSFLGLSGATWGGTWLLEASFPSLTVETKATLSADACGGESLITETINGTITMNSPMATLQMIMEGETSNLLMFTGSSQVNTAKLLSFDFAYDTLTNNIGNFGTVPTLDLEQSFGNMLIAKFTGPLVMNTLQTALNGQMPMKP